MRTRIVVADQSEVCFYDIEGRDAAPRPAGRLTDPQAHLHDRDFKSDAPGRVFDHAPGPGRRGATGHHSTGADDRRPRKHEAQLFARHIAEALQQAKQRHSFDRLILIAGPPFLGVLREALPAALRATVVAEVPKDLIHQDLRAVQAHLPPEALQAHLPPEA